MDRRQFIRNTTLGIGTAGAAGLIAGETVAKTASDRSARLPREVWIATISLEALEAETYQQMIDKVLVRLEEVAACRPDIVCLPEVFPFLKVSKSPPLAEIAEEPLGPISSKLSEYAKRHGCYVICPIYTRESGRFYNSAVVLDRQGKPLGEYRKIHPTISETEKGILPGPLEPPVFKTDFGVIGVQICFDINWPDGWRRLRRAGAEIIFWPSAFCGGKMLNTMAWMNKCCVVSSTRFDPSKICDITGDDLVLSGRARYWACAPVNLERAVIHGWPYWQQYNDVQKRYGRDVAIRHFPEEGWSVIESLSPDLKVADVLREFDIKTHEQHIAAAESIQDALRPPS